MSDRKTPPLALHVYSERERAAYDRGFAHGEARALSAIADRSRLQRELEEIREAARRLLKEADGLAEAVHQRDTIDDVVMASWHAYNREANNWPRTPGGGG